MDHTCHSRVFSTVTTLLVLLESTAEASHWQVTEWTNRPFLIIIIIVSFTRLPRYWLEQLQWFKREEAPFLLLYCAHTIAFSNKSNSSAVILKRSRQSTYMYRCTPFCSVPRNGGYAYTRNAASSTSCFMTNQKWVAVAALIILRTLIQLLDHCIHCTNWHDVR